MDWTETPQGYYDILTGFHDRGGDYGQRHGRADIMDRQDWTLRKGQALQTMQTLRTG